MSTEILGIAEIEVSQSAKYLTHNEALRQLEGMLVRVLDRNNGGPPGSPSDGDTYIVDSATGDWSAASVNDIAHYFSGAWHFYSPVEGLRIYVVDEDIYCKFDGSNWVPDDHNRAANTETLSADKTLSATDPKVQFLDPGGASRNVTLPAEADSKAVIFWIVNTADAAEDLTVQDDGGTTIGTVSQSQAKWFICDGSSWRVGS